MAPPTYFQTHFPTWKNRVGELVYQKMTISLDDIHDFPYAPNFEAGTTVEHMADLIVDDLHNMMNFIGMNWDDVDMEEP